MQPISEQKPHPVITIDDPEIKNGKQKIPLSWNGISHVVNVDIPEGRENPKPEETMKALNRGIDSFHRKIRKKLHEKSREDEIRRV